MSVSSKNSLKSHTSHKYNEMSLRRYSEDDPSMWNGESRIFDCVLSQEHLFLINLEADEFKEEENKENSPQCHQEDVVPMFHLMIEFSKLKIIKNEQG